MNYKAILFSCAIIFLTTTVGACVENEQPDPNKELGKEQVRGLLVLGEFKHIPDSSQEVFTYLIRGTNFRQYLRFKGPREDLLSFAVELLGEKPKEDFDFQHIFPQQGDGSRKLLPNIGWWPTTSPEGGLGGRKYSAYGVIEVLVVQEGDEATIWILVYEV